MADRAKAENAAEGPKRAGIVLTALIAVAAVANLNLTVTNVALPQIGQAFTAGQVGLNLVAVGYSLGLAASVLYLGAVGDRYGRKMMLLVGTLLAVPASLLAALAPSIGVLFIARLTGGVAAGMAYPTTLAVITALWPEPARTRVVALWFSIGGAVSALGPLVAGALLTQFAWSSVFLVTIPLALVAAYLAWRCVPAHVSESTFPVDNFGGILSVVMVAAIVLAINFAAVPNKGGLALGLAAVGVAAGVGFFVRQSRARAPLYDLSVASRRIFWVAAVAGIVVFGVFMAAMFIGQQFLQNVLGYSTLAAGTAVLPGALGAMLVATTSAKLVNAHGARLGLLVGFAFCLLGFLTMLGLWKEHIGYWSVGVAYLLIGMGVGFAGTPASNSLTASVPVKRAGMASATADLQFDLGGAIMLSILGAVLTAGYASAFRSLIAAAPQGQHISTNTQTALERSFSSAAALAHQYPQYASKITAAAKSSFLSGADWAYVGGILLILVGAAIVFFLFPTGRKEKTLIAQYHAEDASRPAVRPATIRARRRAHRPKSSVAGPSDRTR